MDVRLTEISERRQVTARRVMRTLFEQGPKSRAELSRITRLSKQAVSEIVEFLEARGWVEPGSKSQGGVGRRAIDYRVKGDSAFALAIDLGGTKIDGVLINLAGRVIGKHRIETDPLGETAVVEQVSEMADFLFGNSKKDRSKLRACVVGVPGVPDPANGSVRLAPNIPGWDQFNVERALCETLGSPVFLENDVNLAALGELYFGFGRALANFGFLNLGTGVGMGLILDNRLVRGATGAAGEIGFLPIAAKSESIRTVPEGLLEHAVGGHGLLARYNNMSCRPTTDVGEVFSRAAQNDYEALAVIEESGSLIAIALMCVAACVDVRELIVGGSIGFQDILLKKIEKFLGMHGAHGINIHKSTLANRAGSFGALYLAIRHLAEGIFHFEASGDGEPDYANDFEQTLTASWTEA